MSQGRAKDKVRTHYDMIKTPYMIDCATVKQYVEFKTDILTKDFCINVTDDELYRLSICDSFYEVDRVCTDIINRRW